MSHPADFKYSKSHEFVEVLDGNKVRIGLTYHAQGELGDMTYVELPEVGAEYSRDDVFGVVESVKAVSDLFMPVSGKIVEINSKLEDAAELINEDPYKLGWLIVVEMNDPSELDDLMNKDEYEATL
ncbi:glycine cleavage system protein GcvH [bacterium]|nr:glycine cleavage system protein GcvH [bacterium]MBU1024889.1 glycine cleavage system protein GcvH [bacterium]